MSNLVHLFPIANLHPRTEMRVRDGWNGPLPDQRPDAKVLPFVAPVAKYAAELAWIRNETARMQTACDKLFLDEQIAVLSKRYGVPEEWMMYQVTDGRSLADIESELRMLGLP